MNTLVDFIHIGVFGKTIYHAKNVPSLLSDTILAGNGIYHASNDLWYGTCHYMQGLYFYGRYCAELVL